jgi:hypothetical protein
VLPAVCTSASSKKTLVELFTKFATGKATWWGCGKHIPAVLDQIPQDDRCSCLPQVEVDGKQYPPKGGKAD